MTFLLVCAGCLLLWAAAESITNAVPRTMTILAAVLFWLLAATNEGLIIPWVAS